MRPKRDGIRLFQKYLMAALFSVALVAAVYAGGSLLKADADSTGIPESIANDPLDGAWKYHIVPKNRATISYMDNNWSIRTFRGQNESVANDEALKKVGDTLLDVSNTLILDVNDNNRVFAMASCPGQITEKITVSPDFYTQSEYAVPRSVVCNVYLYMKDGENGSTYLAIELLDKNGLRSIACLTDGKRAPAPAYKYRFKADGSWVDAPALDMNVCTDVQGYDWNGDGYTDYVISYVYNPNGRPKGDNEAVGIAVLYVDGKSLLENDSNPGNITYFWRDDDHFSDTSNIVGGLTQVKPAGSMRTALGDFNGDGVKEVALYHTMAQGPDGLGHNNSLHVYSIDLAKGEINKPYENDSEVGQSYLQNDSVGIAAGDLNGDGRDELCLVNADTSAYYQKSSLYLTVLECTGGLDSWSIRRGNHDTGERTFDGLSISGENCSMPPIDAELADLDGDGVPELVWFTATSQTEHDTTLFVAKWPGSYGSVALDSDPSICYWDMEHNGWAMANSFMRYSMACGHFNYPSANQPAVVTYPSQIGVTQLGNGGNLDWVIYEWNSNDGFIRLGSSNSQGQPTPVNDAKAANLVPRIVAADLDGESLVLGEPTVITVEDNIELYMVTQAPPKHWDRVNAAGSALSGYAEEDGKVTLDSFAVFDTDGYYTGMQRGGEWGRSTSVTNASSGKFGASLGLEISHRGSVMDRIFNRSENNANEDPMLDVGGKFCGEWVNDNTEDKSSTSSYTFSYKADRDDQLYYRANDYNICRYPVIFPDDKKFITVSDDNGEEYQAQNYIQFVIPTETASTFTPTPGRSISWYEPLHDNYNLFTYPRRLSDITGYPQGTEEKLAVDKYNPWADINGKVFVDGTGNVIGNLDASEFRLDASSNTTNSEMSSSRYTLGGYVYFHPTVGQHFPFGNREGTIKFDMEGDGTWGTDTTTTTDVSEMFSVTMAWPGARNYTMYTEDWTAADMQFESDIAYFTQDDGALCVGYAVPKLESFQSKIWGSGSPYNTHADPGLLLPFRWSNDIKNKSAGQNLESMIYYLAENDNPNTSHQMRGLSFEMTDGGALASTADHQGTATKLLECGQKYNLRLRVINYSFVDTGEVKVKFYYQPWNDGGENYPAESPEFDGRCEEIHSDDGNPAAAIDAIKGRKNKETGDNWEYAVLNGWTAPKDTGLGWLHAVISYNGEQLSTDNDHGCVLVGSYRPEDFYGTVSAQAKNVSRAASISVESYPDIAITGVTAYEMAKDGTVSQEPLTIDEKSRSKKMKIDVRVKYTGGRLNIGGEEKEINYVPLLRVGLLAGKRGVNRSLLGATEFPLIRAGEERTFSFVYDPKLCDYDNGVAVRAFSPYLFASEQRDPRSQYKVLWNSIEHDGGSGGCGVGLGALALLALLPLAWRKKR